MSKRHSTTGTTGAISGSTPRRNPLLAALGTVLAASANGCADESAPVTADEPPSRGLHIGLALPDTDSDFSRGLLAGARAEARAQGVRLTFRDAGGDTEQQDKDLRHFAAQGVDAVVRSPVDPTASGTELRHLTGGGTPAVTAGRSTDGTHGTPVVAPDHAPIGRLAADALATALGGRGDIAVLRGSKNPAKEFAFAEFRAGLKPHSIRITATRSAAFDRAEATAVMTRLLAADPALEGVFAESDAMALGAAEAAAAMGVEDLRIVAFEGTEAGRRAVRDGRIVATITDQPKEIGRVAVRNAVRAARGEEVDTRILVPMRVVTKANVKDFG